MSAAMPSVISIGECMVELAREADGRYVMSFGGDTFNTAVYLARAGIAVRYATLLGDDPYSARIRALAEAEGVATDLIGSRAGRNAGLYLIETSAAGERTFHYWRERAPARELFDGAEADTVCAALGDADIVYLSGITLSLYAPPARDKLAAALVAARAKGTRIAIDGNARPRGWNGDMARARAELERFWSLADIAMPSLEDGTLLWGDTDGATLARRLLALGVGEVVVKCGPDPVICTEAGRVIEVAVPTAIVATDTTAAGDSFNAAYLAARLAGADPVRAAGAGHRLAGVVVQHRGAIVPRAATASVLTAARA
jgi:2-dehydro-3-deoxygluconokinase